MGYCCSLCLRDSWPAVQILLVVQDSGQMYLFCETCSIIVPAPYLLVLLSALPWPHRGTIYVPLLSPVHSECLSLFTSLPAMCSGSLEQRPCLVHLSSTVPGSVRFVGCMDEVRNSFVNYVYLTLYLGDKSQSTGQWRPLGLRDSIRHSLWFKCLRPPVTCNATHNGLTVRKRVPSHNRESYSLGMSQRTLALQLF